MEDHLNSKGLCQVCHEELTTINAELGPGMVVYVCEKCIESAKENFIWICMHCGNAYIRPKTLVLKRLRDPELKRAFAACADLQLIQGVDQCIECAPEGVMECVASAKSEKHGGHC